MRLTLSVPDYSPEDGLICEFEEDYRISVEIDEDLSVCMAANKAGLITLAKLMLTLASDNVPDGVHMHLDTINGALEDNSNELIICKAFTDTQ
jgi:hypothetical protein